MLSTKNLNAARRLACSLRAGTRSASVKCLIAAGVVLGAATVARAQAAPTPAPPTDTPHIAMTLQTLDAENRVIDTAILPGFTTIRECMDAAKQEIWDSLGACRALYNEQLVASCGARGYSCADLVVTGGN